MLEGTGIQVFINIDKMTTRVKYLFLLLVTFIFTQPLFSQGTFPLVDKNSSIQDTAFVTQLYSQALKEISQQNFPGAQNILVQLLKADPNHEDARFALIRIYFAQKQIDNAEFVAKEGIKLNQNKTLFWEALADIYKETKNYTALLLVFDELIRIHPDEIKNYLDKAYTYTLNKDYKDAIKFYNTTEKKFGANESVYSGRVAVYLQQGKSKKAIQETNSYLQKNKEQSTAYLMLANLYLNLKDPDNALKVADEAESKFPNDPYIHLTKADAYKQLNNDNDLIIQLKSAFANKTLDLDNKIKILFNIFRDFEPQKALVIADALCQVIINTHPQEPNAYAVYGDILLQQNKNEAALVEFKKAIKLNPDIEIVWENILQIEVSEAKYWEAQRDGELALNRFPQNPTLLLFTGYAFLLDKKYEKAQPFIEDALNNADPKNSVLMLQIYSSLGDLYNHLGMGSVSNVAYDEALKIDSNNTYVLNNYAYYLSERKEDLEKAARYSKRSNELQPGNASFQDTYAWVLFQQGKYKEALVWITDALESTLEPSAVLLEHHGDILFKLGKEEEALSTWEDALRVSLLDGRDSELLKKKIKNKKYEE